MKRSFTILVVLLFILINFSVAFANNLSENKSQIPDEYGYKDLFDNKNEIIFKNNRDHGSFSKLGSNENNAHGGSWLDSFENDEKVDISNTQNVNIIDDEVKLNKTDFIKILDDDFSKPLNTSNWINNTGFGTTLFTYPFLKAVKNSQAQTNDAYIEYKRSFNYSRIIEWDWNSYSDNTVGGYGHKFDLYRTPSKIFWVSISARRYIYIKEDTTTLYSSPSPLVENRWYKMKMTITSDSATFEVRETSNNNLFLRKTVYPTYLPANKNGTLRIQFAGTSAAVFSFDVRLDNFKLYEYKLLSTGNITSKNIDLPSNSQWDTLIMNKLEPKIGSIKLSLLNATNDKPIPGFINLSVNNEIDISILNNLRLTSIKLHAHLSSFNNTTPKLFYWGVSWNSSNSWRDTFFGGFKSNPINLTYEDGETWLNTSTTELHKYTGNPVLNLGTSSTWDDFGVQMPAVVYNGTGYMMYYLGQADTNNYAIGLATSKDGISWTRYAGNPILTGGPASAWDENYIGHPEVIYDGIEYKMWYGGRSSYWQIGYANSSDGYSWIKHPSNPVIKTGASGSWDDWYATLPGVYFNGFKYEMWYTGLEDISVSSAPYTIGYADSYDCTNWTKYSNNPVITGLQGYFNGVTRLSVVNRNGQYLGWYSYKIGNNDVRIDHAVSNDGLNWNKYINNPILTKGTSGSWDDQLVSSCDIIYKDKQYWMYYTGHDGSNRRIGLAKSKFAENGLVFSNEISIPDKSYYHTLVVNKTEPSGTYINVTILDGTTQKAIENFKNIRENSIDISKISSIDHPTLILKANIDSTTYATPILYDWSINWTENNGPKIQNISSLPKVNRTFSIPLTINLSDIEDNEDNLTLQVEYKSPTNTNWQTTFLSDLVYEKNYWRTDFTPGPNAVLGDYQFKFICNDSFQFLEEYLTPYFIEVMNNEPIIWDITTATSEFKVNRTHNIDILINATDIEKLSSQLTLKANYKSPLDIDWKPLPNLIFIDGHWVAKFNPLKTANLGSYDFNISCNDSDCEIYCDLKIDVINNLPSPPQLLFMPTSPFTTDNIDILATGSKDVETGSVEYWYYWFKDDVQIQLLDNSTTVPSNDTRKNENWRCVVFPFDGDDLGAPNETSVKIRNSGPVIDEEFTNFEMYEDTPIILENKFNSIFSDPDNDPLTFNVKGEVNITVEITQFNGTIRLTPKKDWFGFEKLTFTATDNEFNRTELNVQINVQPTNDLPRITKIGSQIIASEPSKLEFVVKQNHWLNLTIGVSDIDGDVERGMINYIMNITERPNLYFKKSGNELAFNPTNTDVGTHYITIRITDNNETPPIYISQDIVIQVLNVNDPPTASILQPSNNKKFVDAKQIILDCEADDIDFYIPNPNEELSYKWESNITGQSILGFDKRVVLANETLPKPGSYYIRLTVTDKAGLNATETINIIVQKTPKERETGESTFDDYFMLTIFIIIIIIIIIIAVAMFLMTQRKKREREAAIGVVAPPQEVLQPVESYRPEPEAPAVGPPSPAIGGAISAPVTAEGLVGAAMAPTEQLTPSPESGPTTAPQLPPTQPTPESQSQVEKSEEEGLSPQEKIKLLEERLLRGEIDQDVYLNLKAKYDIEAKPYEPSPQLPPATGTMGIEPEPTQPIPVTPPPTVEPPADTPQVTESPPISETPTETTQTEPPMPSDMPPDAYQQAQETQPTEQPTEQPYEQQPTITQPQTEQSPEQQTKEKPKTEEEQQ